MKILFFLLVVMVGFWYRAVGQSDPVAVVAKPLINNSNRIVILPNPVYGNSYFYVQIDSCQTRSIDKLIIYNSNGYIIQNKTIELLGGNNRFRVGITGYSPGYYTIRLVGANIPATSYSTQILVNQ